MKSDSESALIGLQYPKKKKKKFHSFGMGHFSTNKQFLYSL